MQTNYNGSTVTENATHFYHHLKQPRTIVWGVLCKKSLKALFDQPFVMMQYYNLYACYQIKYFIYCWKNLQHEGLYLELYWMPYTVNKQMNVRFRETLNVHDVSPCFTLLSRYSTLSQFYSISYTPTILGRLHQHTYTVITTFSCPHHSGIILFVLINAECSFKTTSCKSITKLAWNTYPSHNIINVTSCHLL